MSIPASAIVRINPRLINAGGDGLELNGVLVTADTSIPVDNRVLQFTSPEDNAAYFGSASALADAGTRYFLGYNNSFKKPATLYVARWVKDDAAPYLRGGAVAATVGDFRQVTAGMLSLTLGGYTAIVSDLDFSGVNSYSDAALILQTAIRAVPAGGDSWANATVTYTSLFKAFVVTGGQVGSGFTIEPATGDTAELMMLTETAGAVTSKGADAESLAACMDAVVSVTQNWVSFATDFPATEEEELELAGWSNGKGTRYLYVMWDMGANLLTPFGTANIGSKLQELEMSAVAGVYGKLQHAAFILGMIASIDYTRVQGAITMAFKGQDGLEITVTDEETANALDQKGFNWYGDYATANDQFRFFYPGAIFGRYLFIDTYVNAVWLNNALQLALVSLFQNIARIPYTEKGYALVRAALADPINQAKNAGVIDPGVMLSEAQKAQVNREAGLNIAPSIEQDGYYVQVKDPTAQVRAQRGTPIVNLWYAYGGSIHKIEMASTVII